MVELWLPDFNTGQQNGEEWLLHGGQASSLGCSDYCIFVSKGQDEPVQNHPDELSMDSFRCCTTLKLPQKANRSPKGLAMGPLC